MPKKQTTLDDIAGMVQRGFNEMTGQFGTVNKQFEVVNKRLDTLENGQEEIKLRVVMQV